MSTAAAIGEGGAIEEDAEAAFGGGALVGSGVCGEIDSAAADDADEVDHVAIGDAFGGAAGMAFMGGIEEFLGIGVIPLAADPIGDAVGVVDEVTHFVEESLVKVAVVVPEEAGVAEADDAIFGVMAAADEGDLAGVADLDEGEAAVQVGRGNEAESTAQDV